MAYIPPVSVIVNAALQNMKPRYCKCENPIYMIGVEPKICQRCGRKVTNSNSDNI